jgi:hypothetical protein
LTPLTYYYLLSIKAKYVVMTKFLLDATIVLLSLNVALLMSLYFALAECYEIVNWFVDVAH